MDFFDKIETEMKNLKKRQLQVFAVATAERLAPLCREFGYHQLVRLFDEGLLKLYGIV